jgi:hypothetical protein
MVVMHLAAHREHPALGIGRDLEVPILLALVVGGGEALAAVLDPFDRRAEEIGRRRHHQLLRIKRVLRPETAADMRRDHAHLAFREAKRVDDDALGLVRHLRAVPDREQVLDVVVARKHGAGLDRMAAALVDAEALRDAVRGVREGTLGVAILERPVGKKVVGAVEPCLRRVAPERGDGISHRRQLLVVKHDQAGGVLGDGTAFGHHQSHRLAGVAHLLFHQPRWVDMVPDRRHRQRQWNAIAANDRAEIAIGEHGADAVHGLGRADIDAVQPRMRHRAAHEARMQDAGERDVVDKASAAAQQCRVLDA